MGAGKGERGRGGEGRGGGAGNAVEAAELVKRPRVGPISTRWGAAGGRGARGDGKNPACGAREGDVGGGYVPNKSAAVGV